MSVRGRIVPALSGFLFLSLVSMTRFVFRLQVKPSDSALLDGIWEELPRFCPGVAGAPERGLQTASMSEVLRPWSSPQTFAGCTVKLDRAWATAWFRLRGRQSDRPS